MSLFSCHELFLTGAHIPGGGGIRSLSSTFMAAFSKVLWGHLRNIEVESLKCLTHIKLEEFTFRHADKNTNIC